MYNPEADQLQTNIAFQGQMSIASQPDAYITPLPLPPPYTEYGQPHTQQPFVLQPQTLLPSVQQQQVVNTVVVQQPGPIVAQGPREWTSDLSECGGDCGVCLAGLCSCVLCIPFIQCQLSGSAGECCCIGIMCPLALRTKIRIKHNIKGDILGDCCVLLYCYFCAFCQMQREVDTNGI